MLNFILMTVLANAVLPIALLLTDSQVPISVFVASGLTIGAVYMWGLNAGPDAP